MEQWYLCHRQKPLISILIYKASTKESNVNEASTYLPLTFDINIQGMIGSLNHSLFQPRFPSQAELENFLWTLACLS